MNDQEKEIEQLRSALEYERTQRYAAEMAATNTHEVRRSIRPELNAHEELENEQWH